MVQQAKKFNDPATNYLLQRKVPSKTADNFYDDEPKIKDRFSRVFGADTHAIRRQRILKDHPEVVHLLKPDKTFTIIISTVLFPLTLYFNFLMKDVESWTLYFLSIYFISGGMIHAFHILAHDLTHDRCFPNPTLNRILAIICNIPSAIPSAIAFGKYHADHHNYLGVEGKDPDLPIFLEASLSLKYGRLFRIPYLFASTLFYAFRPLLAYPSQFTPWEAINFAFIFVTDLLIVKYLGFSGLIYALLSTVMSIGPHPVSMHFFIDHFETIEGLETNDYIGPMNILNMNAGYHIQHHDFPTCPWYNLPKLREIAIEYYDYLPIHTSFLRMMWKFVSDPNCTLFLRTLREPDESKRITSKQNV